jgi:hypothetical protein
MLRDYYEAKSIREDSPIQEFFVKILALPAFFCVYV